jgi:hypothetical protein
MAPPHAFDGAFCNVIGGTFILPQDICNEIPGFSQLSDAIRAARAARDMVA